MREGRVPNNVVKARVEEVVRVLLDGALSIDIVEFIRQREAEADSPFFVADGRKPITYSTARRYVNRAEAIIGQIAEQDHSKLLGRHIAQRRALFAKAVNQGDVRGALAVLDSEANLLNLFPGRRVHAGHEGEQAISLNILVQAIVAAEQKTLAAVIPAMQIIDAGPQVILTGDCHHAPEENRHAERQGSEQRNAEAVSGS